MNKNNSYDKTLSEVEKYPYDKVKCVIDNISFSLDKYVLISDFVRKLTTFEDGKIVIDVKDDRTKILFEDLNNIDDYDFMDIIPILDELGIVKGPFF